MKAFLTKGRNLTTDDLKQFLSSLHPKVKMKTKAEEKSRI